MHMFYIVMIVIALIILTLFSLYLYKNRIISLYSWVLNTYTHKIPLIDGVEKSINNEIIIDHSIKVTSQNKTSFRIYKPKRIDINSFSHLLIETYRNQYNDNSKKLYYMVNDIHVSDAEIYLMEKRSVLSDGFPHDVRTVLDVNDFDKLYRKVIRKKLRQIRQQVKYDKKQQWKQRKEEYKQMKREERETFKKLLKQEKENE